MIRLSPTVDLQLPCPACKQVISPEDWFLTGMHSVCSLVCSNCGKQFYMEMPVNAGLFYPGIIDKNTGDRVDTLPFTNWYLEGLVREYLRREARPIDFVVESYRPLGDRKIAILNTIDETYGHAIYELFNASFFLKQDVDLIILVQKNLRWLVPDGAAQVWVVDLPFSQAGRWNEWLANRIKQELKGFSDIFLCRSFVQADSSDFDVTDYTGVEKFPLDQWDRRLEKPTITFIWRTDRFWKKVLPKVIDNRYSRKLFGKWIKKIKNQVEFNWILKFADKLKESLPNVDFAVAGMDDRKYTLPPSIKDYRYPVHNDETAILQCQRYAQSHLVIGCNGSSLLLPGCHAGGMINITPEDQWAVSAGTFPFRITDMGDTHFRYVMLPSEVTIDRLVKITLSILRDRSYIQIQTSRPWRDHHADLSPFAWAEFRKQSIENSTKFKSLTGLISKPLNKEKS